MRDRIRLDEYRKIDHVNYKLLALGMLTAKSQELTAIKGLPTQLRLMNTLSNSKIDSGNVRLK